MHAMLFLRVEGLTFVGDLCPRQVLVNNYWPRPESCVNLTALNPSTLMELPLMDLLGTEVETYVNKELLKRIGLRSKIVE